MSIYLDYAAATPLDDDVLAAMQPFFSQHFHNPSALYSPATEVSKALSSARAEVAHILGVKPTEIIFTAGGTEANNLAIHGIMQKYPGTNLVISVIEHDSVTIPASEYRNNTIKVNPDGLVDVQSISQSVDDKTVLVSVMYANNELGTIQPLRRIAAELQKLRQERVKNGNKLPLLFHTDAAQAGNYLDLHVHRLGVDLMTINGGKIYGPKQSGALFVRTGVEIKPLLLGGGQERNMRSGTENVPGVIGLAAALKLAAEKRVEETNRLNLLQDRFIELLQKEFPTAKINGSLKYRLPNNIHVTFPGCDNETVLIQLDNQKIYAAAGSACSASHEEPSRVLAAIGLSNYSIRESLRFSLGRQTTENDVINTVSTLKRLLA